MINDLQNRLMGYCALLSYRYMNLCVKADPVALLSAQVMIDDNDYPLEQVASVAIEDEVTYRFYPIDKNLIPHICKAMLQEHPEFKQNIDGETLTFTVPPVDKDRKDALEDMVDALYKDCELRMKADFGVFSTKVSIAAISLPPETQDECKEELQKTYDGFVQRSGQFKESKMKEIEKAYGLYCEAHEKEEEEKAEKADAEGLENIFKMTLEN